MEKIYLKTQTSDYGKRIDIFLNENLTQYSRSFFQKLIKDGKVRIDGIEVKPNHRLKSEQVVEICIIPPKEISLEPEKIDIDIIYEDDDIAVINKPQGLVVHPAPGNYSGTLVNALLYHCGSLSGTNGETRPGIVHRIDKDTSGLIVVARNDKAHRHISRQIQGKTVLRVYWAIVEDNIVEDEGVIDAPIKRHPVNRKRMAVLREPGSREAITHFRVLERFREFTLVEAKLETGRTHQIRVHMSYSNHPIIGDTLYGSKKQKFNLKGQALHAIKLGFIHPTANKYMEFTAPLPEYFNHILNNLRNMS